MPYVLPLGAAHGTDAWRAGPKATNLSLLRDASFPVPDGFVITTDALDHALASAGTAQRVHDLLAELDAVAPDAIGGRPEQLRSLVLGAALPESLISEVRTAFARLGGAPISVRSSSTMEDRSDVSFAGAHDTVLNVRMEAELWDAVKTCWASLWSDRAVHYLRALGMSVRQMKMGVLVQQMVFADASGVAFTINPITGATNEVVVSAALGLGEGTVSGRITPDEAVVTREPLRLERYATGEKASKVVAGEGAGTVEVTVDATEAGARALTEEQVIHVATLALRAEEAMHGVPQDVEWALRDGELHLLQSRPMVHREVPGAGVRWKSPVPNAHWRRNWRIGEWLSEPVTPLFATWVLPKLVASREESGTGELDWGLRQGFSMLQPWFTIINGYFYTRQDRQPGTGNMQSNRGQQAQRGLDKKAGMDRWRMELLPAYLERFKGHLSEDLSAAPSDMLLGLVDTTTNEAGDFWWFISPIGFGFEEMMFVPFYDEVITAGDRPHYSELFSGYANRVLDGQQLLYATAQEAKADLAFAERLLRETPGSLSRALDELPKWFQERLATYREEYGHQVYSLDFYFPTLGETPEVAIGAVQGYLRYDAPSPDAMVAQAAARRETADRYVTSTSADHSDHTFLLQAMVGFQAHASAREDATFYFQWSWPLMRRVVKELGRRLTEARVLTSPDDVFFLERDELFGIVGMQSRGEHVASLFDDVVSGRKQTWEWQRRLPAPNVIPVVSEDPADARGPKHGFVEDEHGKRLVGQQASPGRVRGPVRIVHSHEDASHFSKGDILVTVAATPAFTPLMLIAGGLVTEAGGGASHSSLVARELGLPAVVNTGVATQVLRDGQMVELDGALGIVRVLD